MFAGFDLSLNESLFNSIDGEEIFLQNKRMIEEELLDFLENEATIDGTGLQNNWFPQFDADVFISHSHNDHKLAVSLAGWLKHEFNLNVFIDSLVWGSADVLLKKIDDNFCRLPNSDSYSYQKRNFSTSHVHMMLSTAISSMIDKSECLFFLNTPNTINTKKIMQQETSSPWIYMEVSISQLIRKKAPVRTILRKGHYEASNREMTINYDLDTGHLQRINKYDLLNWKREHNNLNVHPLDVLYKQHELAESII